MIGRDFGKESACQSSQSTTQPIAEPSIEGHAGQAEEEDHCAHEANHKGNSRRSAGHYSRGHLRHAPRNPGRVGNGDQYQSEPNPVEHADPPIRLSLLTFAH